jgi:hypothetical protein
MQVSYNRLESPSKNLWCNRQAKRNSQKLVNLVVQKFDSEILSRHTCLFIRLLLDLGFLISWKKSQILPSQDFLFLGEHYRTDLGLIFPPEEKFESLCQKILIFSKSFSHGSTIL